MPGTCRLRNEKYPFEKVYYGKFWDSLATLTLQPMIFKCLKNSIFQKEGKAAQLSIYRI